MFSLKFSAKKINYNVYKLEHVFNTRTTEENAPGNLLIENMPRAQQTNFSKC